MAMLERAEARRCCWHCFRALLAPVPCEGCSGVLFCGPRCRDEAAGAYHAFECGITELFFQANVGCWPLAYRGAIFNPHSEKVTATTVEGNGPIRGQWANGPIPYTQEMLQEKY